MRLSCSPVRVASLLTLAIGTSPVLLAAQQRIPSRPSWSSGAVYESWRFASALPNDSGFVESVSQLSLPITVAIPLTDRWSADVSGAYVRGSARVVGVDGAARDLALSGPTDIKVRLAGRLVGDGLTLTAGLNAPTGLTKLAPDEVSALRLLGSPVLRMHSPTLGSGLGATLGGVLARPVASWAVAFGASYEARAAYSPIDVAAAGGVAVDNLDPSGAVHLTLGADRLIGAHRLSLLGSVDLYGSDRLTFASPIGAHSTASFNLGPTVGVLTLMEFGVSGMQELTVLIHDRYRSAFQGIDGRTVSGSNGNSLETKVRARWGAPGRRGLFLGAEARFDTGLAVDESLATAAMSAVGGSVGVSMPAGGFTIEPTLGATVGSIDTGARRSGANNVALSLTIGRR